MSAYVSDKFSNLKDKRIFIKPLIESGIVGYQGEKLVIENQVIDRDIRQANGEDIVLFHKDKQVVGEVLEVFCNGEDGFVDVNGKTNKNKGWWCALNVDEDNLQQYGLTLKDVEKLNLSISFIGKTNKYKTKYNSVEVDGYMCEMKPINVALVENGRFDFTNQYFANGTDVYTLVFGSKPSLIENFSLTFKNAIDNLKQCYNEIKAMERQKIYNNGVDEDNTEEKENEETKEEEEKEENKEEKEEGSAEVEETKKAEKEENKEETHEEQVEEHHDNVEERLTKIEEMLQKLLPAGNKSFDNSCVENSTEEGGVAEKPKQDDTLSVIKANLINFLKNKLSPDEFLILNDILQNKNTDTERFNNSLDREIVFKTKHLDNKDLSLKDFYSF